jgi:hypothetical protein
LQSKRRFEGYKAKRGAVPVSHPTPTPSPARLLTQVLYIARQQSSFAPLYFVAFMVFGSTVMVNLFIAVVMVRSGAPWCPITLCRHNLKPRSQTAFEVYFCLPSARM